LKKVEITLEELLRELDKNRNTGFRKIVITEEQKKFIIAARQGEGGPVGSVIMRKIWEKKWGPISKSQM